MSTQLIDRIRAIVDDGSMSRSGLARAAGLHPNSLRKLDSPDWNPTADTLGKLENWLAHGSDLSPMATPEEIIDEARNGRMFILVDDEDRENEGDLVIPAQMATPDAINFMATPRPRPDLPRADQGARRPARPRADEPPATAPGSKPPSPSRSRRATASPPAFPPPTARAPSSVAIDASKGRDDIVSPGHVFPLVARDGGVLVRAGHTEAAVDVARLAGLNPSGVICEIMNDDGTMARLDDLFAFAQLHGLKIGTIRDLIAYRRRNDHLVEASPRSRSNRVGAATGRLRPIATRSTAASRWCWSKGDRSGQADAGPHACAVAVRRSVGEAGRARRPATARWTRSAKTARASSS